jgi:nucleoside-triphosphatase THEP1
VESIIYKPLNSIWLKASVVGSIWAAIEIIFGSFLHNLKIPLSGTILSFISVYILLSFLQIWKEHGLIIRAGLVCALMKSISPSAIILGPMIGIISEAFLLEFFIFLLGRNIFGYMVGGAAAVLSALIHKLVSLIVLYGLNFITILNALYQFSVKQINLSHVEPLVLVSIIAGIYILAGISAALAGYINGNRYLKKRDSGTDPHSIKLSTENTLFSETTRQNYSVYFLILNFCVIVMSLLLINKGITIFSILFPLLYIGFCVYNYRSSLNRFRKISLWIQFVLITVAAAFIWNGISEHKFFTYSGLIIGLKMIARAVVLIIGFAAIGIELKNPLIKTVLYNKGFANLYQSLSLSFSALPGIIDSLPESKNLFNKSNLKNLQIFSKAEVLLKLFENDHLRRTQVIIITGEISEGKTTFVKDLAMSLIKQNIRIAGFICPGIDENGDRKGFSIINLETSGQFQLCTKEPQEDWFKHGPFYFNPKGIEFGEEILNPVNLNEKQLVIIDEIGPVELKNKGWNNSIEKILSVSLIPQVWVVRKSIVDKIIRKWNTGNIYIFDIKKSSIKEVENKIMELIYSGSQYDLKGDSLRSQL